MSPTLITGERSDHKVAAIFRDAATAREVAGRVRAALDSGESTRVEVITPDDPHPGRKMESDSRGIFRTIIRAHIVLGIAGLVAGLLLFAVLYAMGVRAVTTIPGIAAAVLGGFGAVFGLFAGGLVSIRPDHEPYMLKIREALEGGRCAVVVHARSVAGRDHARGLLEDEDGNTIATL